MPWFKREELPEELRDLSPAQIAEAVKETATLKKKTEELEAAKSETSKAFESAAETNKAMERKIQELETAIASKADAQRKEPEVREKTDFIVDGDKAFAERAVPLTVAILDTRKIMARGAAAQALGAEFSQWGQEIDQLATGCSLAQLGDKATWEHLFYNVKGRKTAALEHKDSAEGAGGGNNGSDGKKKPELTEIEKKVAKKLGLTEEVYLKNKTEMTTDPTEGLHV